jgi:hypothetical protein
VVSGAWWPTAAHHPGFKAARSRLGRHFNIDKVEKRSSDQLITLVKGLFQDEYKLRQIRVDGALDQKSIAQIRRSAHQWNKIVRQWIGDLNVDAD